MESSLKTVLISIPKQDVQVQECLRLLGLPVILYGEKPSARHERLYQHIERLSLEERRVFAEKYKELNRKSPSKDDAYEKETSDRSYQSSKELLEARLWCRENSLSLSKNRLEKERAEKRLMMDDTIGFKFKRQELYSRLKDCSHISTQVGSDRPLSYCAYTPDRKWISTVGWAGSCNTFSLPLLDPNQSAPTLSICTERISCIEYHPKFNIDKGYIGICGDMSGRIHLFELLASQGSNGLKATINGHLDRVSRLALHPYDGRWIASASFDTTWRLWDVERISHGDSSALLVQEGHSKQVYSIDFHIDGALIGTGGLDACGMIWDIRSGKRISILSGHSQGVLGLSFSPNGHDIATCGEDNSVRIWDLRRPNLEMTHIAAHTNTVTSVKFAPNVSDPWILSTSHDQTAKIWSLYDWRLLCTLQHNIGDKTREASKVMHGTIIDSLDSADSCLVATVSYDRTIKSWRIPSKSSS
jgi:U4/U6 small nuclear ribonucleoprotein PRP4